MIDRKLVSASLISVVIIFLLLLSVAAVPAPVASQESGLDFTVYSIQVHEDGDATWVVEYRRPLQNEREVKAFKDFMSEFDSGNITVFPGIEELRNTVRNAEQRVGREMSVTSFERDVFIQNTVTGKIGIARVEFDWINFAEKRDQTLVAGDVLNGLVIGQDQRLVIEYDRNLTLEEAVPQPHISDSNSIRWDGKYVFEEGNPILRFNLLEEQSIDGNASGNGDGNGDGETPGISDTPDGIDGNNSNNISQQNSNGETSTSSPSMPAIAVVIVLITGFVGGVLSNHYLQRRYGSDESETSGETTVDEIEGGDEREEGFDEDLLTDEDRVIRLLRKNGGRMKQVDIVEETGWSKSKVSMVLSKMEENGIISKLRLGRENVIDLNEEDRDE